MGIPQALTTQQLQGFRVCAALEGAAPSGTRYTSQLVAISSGLPAHQRTGRQPPLPPPLQLQQQAVPPADAAPG